MNLDAVKEFIWHPVWTTRHYFAYYLEAQQQIREANQELSGFFGLEPVEVSIQFKKPAISP